MNAKPFRLAILSHISVFVTWSSLIFLRILGNYMKFHSAIKGVYPDIKIISNCDGSVQKLDHPADLYDFHVRISLQRLNHYIILSMFIFHVYNVVSL